MTRSLAWPAMIMLVGMLTACTMETPQKSAGTPQPPVSAEPAMDTRHGNCAGDDDGIGGTGCTPHLD